MKIIRAVREGELTVDEKDEILGGSRQNTPDAYKGEKKMRNWHT